MAGAGSCAEGLTGARTLPGTQNAGMSNTGLHEYWEKARLSATSAMTTYEHAMLGVTGVLTVGLDRRYGWPIVALGGFVAVLPDWDGLSILCGAAVFDRVHRTVGHNLLGCLSLGALVAALDYRYCLALRVKAWAGRQLRALSSQESSPERSVFRLRELSIWVAVGVVASLSHLAADVAFSGHAVLSDWGLRLLWPFSDRLWAYPMVSWGEPPGDHG